jgi:hypothetical protein
MAKTKKSKLKKLHEMSFETLGEEYIFLYEAIYGKSIDQIDEKEKVPEIEELRQDYNLLFNEQDIKGKYDEKNVYWGSPQEKSIIEYIQAKTTEEKSIIFSKSLYKPFKKLIENIIFTYKLFRDDVNINELQNDCMSFLATKIDKFDPTKGTKSYAYFGTMAKHYLMGEKKTMYKMTKTNVDIDDSIDDVSSHNFYNIDDVIEEDSSLIMFSEIIKVLEAEIQGTKMLLNDKKVAEAIIWVFKNHEILSVYNKNLVYHLLKERTGLQTKEITYSLSRLKSFYRAFKLVFMKKAD